MALLHIISAAIARRSAYLRTRRALRDMPLDVALDLGIDRENAGQIAHRAVYGH